MSGSRDGLAPAPFPPVRVTPPPSVPLLTKHAYPTVLLASLLYPMYLHTQRSMCCYEEECVRFDCADAVIGGGADEPLVRLWIEGCRPTGTRSTQRTWSGFLPRTTVVGCVSGNFGRRKPEQSGWEGRTHFDVGSGVSVARWACTNKVVEPHVRLWWCRRESKSGAAHSP